MLDYVRISEDGEPIIDFSNLSRDEAAAVVQVSVEDFIDGRGEDAREVRRVTFKLADKRAALVDLGKHHKLFVERVVHDIGDRIAERLGAALRRVEGKERTGDRQEPPKLDAPRKAKRKGKRARVGRKQGGPT